MKKKFQTFKYSLMKKQLGIQLLVLLVLFSHHPTAVETKNNHRQGLDQTSHNRHKWMDMMQATQSQQCHTLQPENRDTQDKLVLAPIVFQGRLISRSNVYNSLYFVSLRVQRVLKGSVPKRMHRHMRLLFHTDSPKHHSTAARLHRHRIKAGTSSGNSVSPCRPVTFEVKTGQKYAIYVKKVEMGRYVAVATPDTYTRKVRKAARKLLCQNCLSSPKVTGMTEYLSVSQGGKIKLKCKIAGSPLPKVTWLKDGRPLHHDFHISIKTKRKRSILRLSDAQGRDGGKYTCRATNVLGEQSQTTSISVRVLAPDPPASTCPIEQFCLNGGKCLYYPMIGEHVCRCPNGFAGQRCQFKKALINLPFIESEACGPYGHDIHLREICAAWKRPPITEMTREEYESWLRVEKEVAALKRNLQLEEMRQFRQMSRPSFQLKPRQIIDQDDDNENEESSSKNSASTSFLDNSNYVNEE